MKELRIPKVMVARTAAGVVYFKPPNYLQNLLWHMLDQARERKIDGFDVTIRTPTKPRTTGWRSQNHRINGFIQQISMYSGMDFETLKVYFKKKALTRGYPFETDPDGDAVPYSEARIDTVQASYLINEIEQFAAENDITLKEYEE